MRPFFNLDEKGQLDICRAMLQIRAFTACMEQVICEKRCRHFGSLWQQLDLSSQPELGTYYQQQIYIEKQRIAELNRQRQVVLEELIGVG